MGNGSSIMYFLCSSSELGKNIGLSSMDGIPEVLLTLVMLRPSAPS